MCSSDLPFAGWNSPATIRNDINPNREAEYHLDFSEFLKVVGDGWDGTLFDPPYSLHQVNQVYEGHGLRKQYSLAADLISGKIVHGGHCISFGWNTNGLGKSRGFEIKEILIVAHGGSHNDTLVTVEGKL